jgi:hypothetical protein
VMSRYPLLGTGGRVLTRERSVAQATLDVAGTPVNVFATHIESGAEREARAEQVALLLPYMARFATPRILNGDMNAGPDRDEIQPLFASYVDAWDRAVRAGAASSYSDNPPSRYTRTRGARIDYILVSNEGGLRVTGCEIPDLRDRSNGGVERTVGTSDDRGVRPSDHNLVTCTLALGTPPKSQEAGPDARDVVMRAADAETVRGWTRVADAEAAGGVRLATTDAGVAITVPLEAPATYFDLPFEAEASRPYRLWVRGLAQGSHRLNDSLYVQFSDSVTQQGEPVYRIGTASATTVVLEEFLHAGLSGWAWADNGWDSLGSLIYFATSGPHTLRVQLRQDGVSVDQIVLSPGTYLWTSPGSTKEDRTILPAPLR